MTQATAAKISPAFEPFLADSGPNDKRDAIVIYRSEPPAEPQLRGRLRELKQRMGTRSPPAPRPSRGCRSACSRPTRRTGRVWRADKTCRHSPSAAPPCRWPPSR